MKLNNTQILAILVMAKEQLLNDKYKEEIEIGMCYYLVHTIQEMFRLKNVLYEELNEYIPEFTYQYLVNSSESKDFYVYWWNPSLITPRLEAFNKLISLYINKIKDENN